MKIFSFDGLDEAAAAAVKAAQAQIVFSPLSFQCLENRIPNRNEDKIGQSSRISQIEEVFAIGMEQEEDGKIE